MEAVKERDKHSTGWIDTGWIVAWVGAFCCSLFFSLEVGDENLCMRTKGAIAYLDGQTMKVALCERLIEKSLM